MNKPINAISASVETKYLYDGCVREKDVLFTPCNIVGVSSYLSQPLTFHVLINNAYLYSNIPITALRRKLVDTIHALNMTLQDLSYVKCNTLDIDIFALKWMTNPVKVYFPRVEKWIWGEYCFSCDFYTGNDLLHFTKLDTWQFAWVPNHKINFNAQETLPDYKKCHTEWTW